MAPRGGATKSVCCGWVGVNKRFFSFFIVCATVLYCLCYINHETKMMVFVQQQSSVRLGPSPNKPQCGLLELGLGLASWRGPSWRGASWRGGATCAVCAVFERAHDRGA